MHEDNQPVDPMDEYDAAYDEDFSADEHTEDDTEQDIAEQDEAEASEDNEPTPEDQDSQDESPEHTEEQEQEQEALAPDSDEDVEALRQKLRSAEGRLNKFEESVDEMRERLKKYEPTDATPKPSSSSEGDVDNDVDDEQNKPALDDADFVPPGMDKDDWLDLQEDYPETAEALKKQFSKEQQLADENRQFKEQQERQKAQDEDRKVFRKEILDAHPDYDTVIAPKVDDVKAFINEQDSAVMKQYYQRIFDQGSASEINALVTDYKTARNLSGSKPTQTQKPSSRKVKNAMAVPSRGGGNPNLNKATVDDDDFDAAWDEADED